VVVAVAQVVLRVIIITTAITTLKQVAVAVQVVVQAKVVTEKMVTCFMQGEQEEYLTLQGAMAAHLVVQVVQVVALEGVVAFQLQQTQILVVPVAVVAVEEYFPAQVEQGVQTALFPVELVLAEQEEMPTLQVVITATREAVVVGVLQAALQQEFRCITHILQLRYLEVQRAKL